MAVVGAEVVPDKASVGVGGGFAWFLGSAVAAVDDVLTEAFAPGAVAVRAAGEGLFFVVFADGVVVGVVAVGGVELEILEAEAMDGSRAERFVLGSGIWMVQW